MKAWLLSFLLAVQALAAPLPTLELVESVPLETEAVLDDPEIRQTLEVWLELVQGARKSIDLEFFYLRHEPGKALQPVVDALEAAAQRGVRVRVLVDSKFVKTYPELVGRWSQTQGFAVRPINMAKLAGGVQHAKMMVVDGERFFLGSQNFDWTALTHIRELGVSGHSLGLARAYSAAFEQDWSRAGGQAVESQSPDTSPLTVLAYGGQVRVFPVFSPADPAWSLGSSEEKALVDLLRSARKSVSLQVMDYSPVIQNYDVPTAGLGYYPTLDQELRAAAVRGVQVQLLVADWGAKSPHREHLLSLAQIPNVEVRVGTIPPWSGGQIPFTRVGHSKYLLVDGERGWIGTSNWKHSYFHTSRDAGLVFEGASLAERVARFFGRDWNGPYVKGILARPVP